MEDFFNIDFEKPFGKEDWQRVWQHLMGSRIAIQHNGKTIVGQVLSYGWHPDKGVDHIGCRCVKPELGTIAAEMPTLE